MNSLLEIPFPFLWETGQTSGSPSVSFSGDVLAGGGRSRIRSSWRENQSVKVLIGRLKGLTALQAARLTEAAVMQSGSGTDFCARELCLTQNRSTQIVSTDLA